MYKDRCVDPLECHSLINRKSFHMHNMSHNCAQSITTMIIVYVNTKFSLTDAGVGFEKTMYHVSEDTSHGVVEICAVVYTANDIDCPIKFPFNVRLTTSGKNAGTSM